MGKDNFSKLIAKRYLFSRQKEAFISVMAVMSVLGIALAVAVLNIVMAIMSGFEKELKERLLSQEAHITIDKPGALFFHNDEYLKTISSVEGIKGVQPYLQSQVLIRFNNIAQGTLVEGISKKKAEELKNNLSNKEAVSLIFNTNAPRPYIVIGKALAASLGIKEGVTISVITPQSFASPLGIIPRFKRFDVAGIYKSKLWDYESNIAFTSLSTLQYLLNIKGQISGYRINVSKPLLVKDIAGKIREKLAKYSFFRVTDWSEANKPLFDALGLEKRVYFIVLVLLIVLASFSVISTLVMLVMEKRKDIAVLRTIGASKKDIVKIFKKMGIILGFLGTALGCIVGYLGCLALKIWGFPLDTRIFPVPTVPVDIELTNFFLVAVVSLVVCYLSTIYPSKRASSLPPAEVLRYE